MNVEIGTEVAQCFFVSNFRYCVFAVHRLADSIHGLLKRLQIRALKDTAADMVLCKKTMVTSSFSRFLTVTVKSSVSAL